MAMKGRNSTLFTLRVNYANELHNTRWVGKMSPFAKITLGRQTVKTPVVDSGGQDPKWISSFPLTWSGEEKMHFFVFDRYKETSDDLIAEGSVSMESVQQGWSGNIPLSRNGRLAGRMNIGIEWDDPIVLEPVVVNTSRPTTVTDAVAVDDKDQQIKEPLERSSTHWLEDLHSSIFSASLVGDARAEAVFDRISTRAQGKPEQASSVDIRSLGATDQPFKAMPQRQWEQYVQKSLASIEKRGALQDCHGKARISFSWHPGGTLQIIRLADWRGRHRASVLFGESGSPQEVRLIHLSKGAAEAFAPDGSAPAMEEEVVTPATFGEASPKNGDGNLSAYEALSFKLPQMGRTDVALLCQKAFSRLEDILQQERDEGRELLPPAEEIAEMRLSRIMQLLLRADELPVH